jgi:hypothetical protein
MVVKDLASRDWRIARGKTIVANDDLDELLCNAWLNRIWTYQEVPLATRPVLGLVSSIYPGIPLLLPSIFLRHVQATRRWTIGPRQ